jgi:hypothetical protein
MTPQQLQSAGHRLYGRKYWKARLADALHVNVATIHRMMHREQLPGPYVVAINALLDLKKRQDALTREARRIEADRKRLAKAKRPRKELPVQTGVEE